MSDRPNGQLPDGALVPTAKEPGQVAYETRLAMHRPFMDWATLSEKWKNEWREVGAAVLDAHSTPVIATLQGEIDRLRKLLARRDSQLAAAGVPCPEIPEGVLPPGVLQAYSDAHRHYPEQSRHLQAHTAGLRAALMVDRAQQVPRTSPDAEDWTRKAAELADRLRAWSENDPVAEYFFGGDGDVFSAMQLDCAAAAQLIQAVARLRDAQANGLQLIEPKAGAEKPLGRVAYEARFDGFTLGRRGVSEAWEDLLPEAQAKWERVARAVQDAAKPTAFRLDPRWTGACLGFEGGCLNLKIPEGSAEFVFREDELELIEEEGRTLFIARLPASEVRAVHRHLAAYLVAPAPKDPNLITTSAQGA